MKCPYCMEEIQDGAIKCKHCRSSLLPQSAIISTAHAERGIQNESLTLPITSFVIGLLSLLMVVAGTTVEGIDAWKGDTWSGWLILSSIPLILGIISVNKKSKMKGLAITGIVLSAISMIICLGGLLP